MNQAPSDFWSISATEMLQRLESSSDGLRTDEARRRLTEFGSNSSGAQEKIRRAYHPAFPIQEPDHPDPTVCHGTVILPA